MAGGGRITRTIDRSGPDTPERIAARIVQREAGHQAHRDTMAKFGPLTADNVEAALAFQQQRIAELMREGGL